MRVEEPKCRAFYLNGRTDAGWTSRQLERQIAGNSHREIESDAGESVITAQNAAQLNTLLRNMIEDVADSSGEYERRNKKYLAF